MLSYEEYFDYEMVEYCVENILTIKCLNDRWLK